MDTYQIYDGTDENGIVGTVAPGLFVQEGRCWRMVYENPVGHGGHCLEPVALVGRWKFLKGWTKAVRAIVAGSTAGRRTQEMKFPWITWGQVWRAGVDICGRHASEYITVKWGIRSVRWRFFGNAKDAPLLSAHSFVE